MSKIWYIHGANATPRSFAFMKQWLTEHESVDIHYLTDEPIIYTLQDLEIKLRAEPEMVHIVGHSLGGIFAVALAQRVPEKVLSVVTMSTPFRGSSDATMALLLKPFDPLLMNASSINPIISMTRKTEIEVPLLKIITTAGDNTLISGDNDGVITVSSQRSYEWGEEKKFALNHFEVLLSEEVARTVKAYTATIEQLEGV